MDKFPIEITTEILSRVSVKYVFRCRSVCKTWKIIIDDRRRFAPLHYTRSLEQEKEATHPNKPTLIFASTGKSHPIYLVEVKSQESQQQQQQPIFKTSQIDFCGPDYNTNYANSCHGLLCFSSQSSNIDDNGCSTYIRNPATHEFVKLPTSPLPSHESMEDVLLGDLAPRPCVHNIGFGYDHSSNAFKVLQILYMYWGFCFAQPVIAQVCTLGTNSWRELKNFPRVSCFGSTPALIEGSLHWLSYEHILSFDLASENFRSVEYPLVNFVPTPHFGFYSKNPEDSFQLVALDGCLSIADLSYEEDLELWIMKEYNVKESWIKLIIKKRYVGDGVLFQNVLPICFWKNGELLLLYGSNILVSYGIQSGRYTPYEVEGLPANGFRSFTGSHGYEIYPYVGNLMSIDTMSDFQMQRTLSNV